MTAIKDIVDSAFPPASMPSSAAFYDLAVANEAGLRLGIFGDREGAINSHNHTSRGGRLLSRSISTVACGPYSRVGSGLTPVAGVPVYPPTAGSDFSAVAGTSYKLLHHQGLYLPGGVAALRVRAGVNFGGAGARSFTVVFILRPFELMGLKFYHADIPYVSAEQTFFANVDPLLSSDVLLAPLSRLGDVSQGRWYELMIVLITNPTAASSARLIGVNVYPLLSAAQPPPNTIGLPLVQVDTRDIQQGGFITSNLFQQVARLFDGLILATIGRIPGKFVDWGSPASAAKEDKSTPYWQAIQDLDNSKGVHQHTGAMYGDGALIPAQLVSISPCGDMSDTAAVDMGIGPVRGAAIDPTAAGAVVGALRAFKCRVAVARGDTKFFLRVAVRPGQADDQGFLWMYCRSRMILASNAEAAVNSLVSPYGSVDLDIITSIEIGQQGPAQTKGAGNYFNVQIFPEDCQIYQPNSARAAVGKFGNWTEAAMLAPQQMPDYQLSNLYNPGNNNSYRTSKVITIYVDSQGRTGDVQFDFRFYLLNQAGAAKINPTLQWLALVRPEQL